MHYLNASEIAEVLWSLAQNSEDERLKSDAKTAEALLISATTAAASIVARAYKCHREEAENVPGMGGLMVGFMPEKAGDPCPPDLAQYDPGSEWAEGIEDEAEGGQ